MLKIHTSTQWPTRLYFLIFLFWPIEVSLVILRHFFYLHFRQNTYCKLKELKPHLYINNVTAAAGGAKHSGEMWLHFLCKFASFVNYSACTQFLENKNKQKFRLNILLLWYEDGAQGHERSSASLPKLWKQPCCGTAIFYPNGKCFPISIWWLTSSRK